MKSLDAVGGGGRRPAQGDRAREDGGLDHSAPRPSWGHNEAAGSAKRAEGTRAGIWVKLRGDVCYKQGIVSSLTQTLSWGEDKPTQARTVSGLCSPCGARHCRQTHG